MAKPGVFKSALQVLPQRIKHLTDMQLTDLMRDLFQAEGYKSGADPARIIVNTQGNAADDGSDAMTPQSQKPSAWFGTSDTCWQIKSGKEGEASKLRGEVLKKIPSATLKAGGRYIVVASGSSNGEKGRKDRQKILVEEAIKVSIPHEKIDVYTSENIANWCNEFPSIALKLNGMPDGLWTLDTWKSQEEHSQTWFPTKAQKENSDQLHAAFDFATGQTTHAHIFGPPGVGKSRLALELCKSAHWHSFVVYIPQAADQRVAEIISAASAFVGSYLVLVVDEVQQDDLNALCSAVNAAKGRIRLITIGHSDSPDPKRIAPLFVEPLDRETCKTLIKNWHPGMTIEQIDFVAWFSDGYVRLARLASYAVASDPTVTTQKLLELPAINRLMNSLLGPEDRRPLYVVAVLKSVGWHGSKEIEGQAIAAHFGLKWDDVVYAVKRFDDQFRIAPRKGELRYISPEPLGIYLAWEAWGTYQSKYETLPTVLQSEIAKDSYYERFEALAGNPSVRKYAREDLNRLFQSSNFNDSGAVRRWESLTAAQRSFGVHLMHKHLSSESQASRLALSGDARRRLIWALVRFAWFNDSFQEATLSLAELAEAENERWANNATAEFIHRYQIILGGTEVPYTDRLPLLDDLVSKGPSYFSLVIKALSKAGDAHSSRVGLRVRTDTPFAREWTPGTKGAFAKQSVAGINKLISLIPSLSSENIDELIKAGEGWVMLLRNIGTRDAVADYYQRLVATYPDAREPIRKAIGYTLDSERKYWQELSQEDYQFVQNVHDTLVDLSLNGQLRQQLADAEFGDTSETLHKLAQHVIQDPNVLQSIWAWITSGNVSSSWLLGKALGEVDRDDVILPLILDLAKPGVDTRIVSSFLAARASVHGHDWLDNTIDEFMRAYPDRMGLIIDITWRCSPTRRGAARIESIIRSGLIDLSISVLQFGPWAGLLPFESFLSLLNALVAKPILHETAVAFLSHRIDKGEELHPHISDAAAILATSPKLIRSHNMTSYYWGKVADWSFKNGNGNAIIKALFQQQGDKTIDNWFIEHSGGASKLLSMYLGKDPEKAWETLREHLTDYANAMNFSIGFPAGIIDQLPVEQVLKWVAENPKQRANTIARFVSTNVSEDSIGGKLLEKYSEIDGVGGQILSKFIAGVHMGPMSEHWNGVAENLRNLSQRTKSQRIKSWAAEGASDATEMADRYRDVEAEEDLRGF